MSSLGVFFSKLKWNSMLGGAAMQMPLEVTFNDVQKTPWVEEYIQERADQLDQMATNLISCRVVVERAQHRHHTGNPYRTRVEVRLSPHKDLVATKEGVVGDTQVQLRPIIRKAFEAMEKQVRKHTEKRNNDVKHHDEPRALVVRMFPDEGYGFIKSPVDGEEYYFHKNSVLHNDFERLTPGTEVRFEPEMGDEGLQASTVQVVNKPGERATPGEEEIEPPAGWEPTGDEQKL